MPLVVGGSGFPRSAIRILVTGGAALIGSHYVRTLRGPHGPPDVAESGAAHAQVVQFAADFPVDRFRPGDDGLRPDSPCSASKAAYDPPAPAYHRTHGTDVRVTRCPTTYPRSARSALSLRARIWSRDSVRTVDWYQTLRSWREPLQQRSRPGR